MKKLIALALIAAFVISTGVGCSGGSTAPTGGAKPTSAGTGH